MDDYISRQAVMDKFAEVIASSNNSDFARVPSWNYAVGIVEGFPPADVRPVVEGEWTRKHDDVCYWFECSICGHYPPKDRWGSEWISWFCPECGAKMKIDRNCINTEIWETYFEEMVGDAE